MWVRKACEGTAGPPPWSLPPGLQKEVGTGFRPPPPTTGRGPLLVSTQIASRCFGAARSLSSSKSSALERARNRNLSQLGRLLALPRATPTCNLRRFIIRNFIASGRLRGLQEGSKKPQEAPQEGPRGPQDGPKTAQEGPQVTQEPPRGPKTLPRGPKTCLRPPKSTPRRLQKQIMRAPRSLKRPEKRGRRNGVSP